MAAWEYAKKGYRYGLWLSLKTLQISGVYAILNAYVETGLLK